MKKLYALLAIFVSGGTLSAQTYFTEDFEPASGSGGSLTHNHAWTTEVTISNSFNHNWFHGDHSGDSFARISNYNSGSSSNEALESWLVSPTIDLSASTTPTLNFNHTKRYSGADLELYVSMNYDGSNFATATWTNISSTVPNWDANIGAWPFVNSGNLDVTAYKSAQFAIAFRYQGSGSDGSTYQVDDVLINEGGLGPAPDVSIYDIQYTTSSSGASSYNGQVVNTAGIVTAIVPSNPQGYFIQSGTGAWNGVFVEDGTNVPALGDSVEVTGTVTEDFNNTEIHSVTAYNVATTGNTLPAAASITTNEVNFEDYEGVLIATTNAECTDADAGFGQWKIYDGTDTCLVDDVIYSFNPILGNNYGVTGPIFFSYSTAKILPRDANDIAGQALTATIRNIQFTTDANGFSPFNGSNVTVKGVVTAESSAAFNSNDKGYWIAEGSGPWSGIFVWDTTNTVQIGDSVEVSGTVNENFNQTIIKSVSNLNILNSGNTVPGPRVISTDSVNTEEYEGVFVRVEQATCTNASVGFGQWRVNDGSGVNLIDDVMYQYTPVQNSVYNVQGVVYYTFSEYKILPRAAVDVEIFVGIEENAMVTDFYPNPASSIVNFTAVENGTIDVLDVTGKIVSTQAVYAGQNELNVSAFQSGIYLVRFAGTASVVRLMVK